MLTVLEQIRDDRAFGAAWRRCEAALPEGWQLTLKADGQPRHFVTHAIGPYPTPGMGYAPISDTPAAALTLLAEKLEALCDD